MSFLIGFAVIATVVCVIVGLFYVCIKYEDKLTVTFNRLVPIIAGFIIGVIFYIACKNLGNLVLSYIK